MVDGSLRESRRVKQRNKSKSNREQSQAVSKGTRPEGTRRKETRGEEKVTHRKTKVEVEGGKQKQKRETDNTKDEGDKTASMIVLGDKGVRKRRGYRRMREAERKARKRREEEESG